MFDEFRIMYLAAKKELKKKNKLSIKQIVFLIAIIIISIVIILLVFFKKDSIYIYSLYFIVIAIVVVFFVIDSKNDLNNYKEYCKKNYDYYLEIFCFIRKKMNINDSNTFKILLESMKNELDYRNNKTQFSKTYLLAIIGIVVPFILELLNILLKNSEVQIPVKVYFAIIALIAIVFAIIKFITKTVDNVFNTGINKEISDSVLKRLYDYGLLIALDDKLFIDKE